MRFANLSSASVLHILRDTIAKQPASGSPGLMIAMGPGICSEARATALALSRRFFDLDVSPGRGLSAARFGARIR